MRPANLVTAIADVLAGVAIAGIASESMPTDGRGVGLLMLSTVGLYGGGVVFNDVFDADLDAVERPERPIPSGRVTRASAAWLGGILLGIGMLAAALHSQLSGLLAVSIAGLALVYDRFGKHHPIIGPVNMGACRGVNLLLGLSIVESAVSAWWWLGVIPVIYIAAVTMISRGEVHGGNPATLYGAGVMYALVSGCQLWLAVCADTLLLTLPFVILHGYLIFKPLLVAIQKPIGPNIGKAVKAGVLALIVMDAAWVGVAGQGPLALLVLLLLPLSLGVARLFAVT
ncbi:MAG: UbiA-like protein EboC [Cytophagaceae bacterium]|nr:UbiA-like protein EboC [Cytophagaceae bacterium]